MKLADNPLLKPYAGKPVILDANILLLHWCASFDRELVRTFKRLNTFQDEDIDLLEETLKQFSVLRTTPHVLTEVSNLANALPLWRKEDWAAHFSREIEVIPEQWIPAQSVCANLQMDLGLTDAVLSELASTHVILTMDWPLTNRLESQGLNVVNFTRLRGLWLE
jgi:hypothetical protein